MLESCGTPLACSDILFPFPRSRSDGICGIEGGLSSPLAPETLSLAVVVSAAIDVDRAGSCSLESEACEPIGIGGKGLKISGF